MSRFNCNQKIKGNPVKNLWDFEFIFKFKTNLGRGLNSDSPGFPTVFKKPLTTFFQN